ncbi:MAG: hypothetical protein GX616_25885 [Planctomycetes bacterium]|nr:hypothetical protein [Planctomycetota bacterium]
MPMHWTYESFSPQDDLRQGDLLEPAEELRTVFKEVHQHFLDPKYTAFLVTTQSCDLVVRRGRCGTRYINVAVVRPIEALLHSLLSDVCRPVVEGVYLRESKVEANRLMARLFNQNEQALGLFYLHPDVEAGITVPSVALLRVSVALRYEHYDVLKQARRGRISTEFRSKLGWLVGNLYSRIGTQDWTEPKERERELDQLIKDFLEVQDPDRGPVWVPETWVNAAKASGVAVDELPKEALLRSLETSKPPTAKESAIQETVRVIKEVVPDLADDLLTRIQNRLSNDQLFAKALRSAKTE